MEFINFYLDGVTKVVNQLNRNEIKKSVGILKELKKIKGRLFILGVGGSAANASHAVNDFRKITDIETYAPTDNVSELSARINDEGWDGVFKSYLETSKLNEKDCVLVFSVGGGDKENNISVNIIKALEFSKSRNAKSVGIVGYKGGYTAEVADACIKIPYISDDTITPLTESFQAVVWHLLVSHPELKACKTKWEEVVTR